MRPEADPVKVAHLKALRERLDPFALAQAIDQQLTQLYALAHHHPRPKPQANGEDLTLVEKQAVQALSESFGIPISLGTRAHRTPRGK